MVFFETDGANDFASIFASVAEERNEEDERRQTRLFLQILDDMDERNKQRDTPAQRPRLYQQPLYYDRYQDEEEERMREEEERAVQHFHYRRRPAARLRKELMRVSITDDEMGARSAAIEKDERDRKVGKVHTIKDLPQDDFDFFMPNAPTPEVPEITVEPGRRLSDGKVAYHTRFSGFFDTVDWEFLGSFKFELIMIMVFMVFVFGVYFGRMVSRLSAKVHHQQYTQQQQQPIIYYAMPPPHMMSHSTQHAIPAMHQPQMASMQT